MEALGKDGASLKGFCNIRAGAIQKAFKATESSRMSQKKRHTEMVNMKASDHTPHGNLELMKLTVDVCSFVCLFATFFKNHETFRKRGKKNSVSCFFSVATNLIQ